MIRPKLLWVGDAGVPSGFARATHAILDTVRHQFDVTVLGMNYQGSPHNYPYEIWPAAPGGDAFGVLRLIFMCDRVKPDIIIFQNDGWNMQNYIKQLRRAPEYRNVKTIAACAVDGLNFQGKWLDGFDHAIFWTDFGMKEARAGRYEGPATVIPLGIDLNEFYPVDKREARRRVFGSDLVQDAFIIGSVNRNQPRKRWDLTIRYFAKWCQEYEIPENVYLFLHTAPTGDIGIDVQQLAEYYNVLPRIMLRIPGVFEDIGIDLIRDTYNSFDVAISTSQGEGFGFMTFEAMACCIPTVMPANSSLRDLCKGASLLVDCTSTHIGPPYENVIGSIPDERFFIQALNFVYTNKQIRAELIAGGRLLVAEDRFRWENIGHRYIEVLNSVLAPAKTAEGVV